MDAWHNVSHYGAAVAFNNCLPTASRAERTSKHCVQHKELQLHVGGKLMLSTGHP